MIKFLCAGEGIFYIGLGIKKEGKDGGLFSLYFFVLQFLFNLTNWMFFLIEFDRDLKRFITEVLSLFFEGEVNAYLVELEVDELAGNLFDL